VHNGILSIGKAMTNVKTIIVGENYCILPKGEKGELCLAGDLLTPGYWKNEIKNKEAFFFTQYDGKLTRFYRTGDLCVEDEDGDYLYLGRIDFQTKIQGFRVELSEVEFYAKEILEKNNIVAVAYTNSIGNNEIGIAIESQVFDIREFMDSLKLKVPSYMLPSKILFFKNFPLNTNGKTDRKELQVKFEKS
jgi:D-alanine--poly(phosphoribitol) ligase subunit 1